jgi:predicted tellurium resistance membrane protein TerC
MFDWIANPSAWVGLLTLTVLEIVLGIDNIIFISILSNKLPAHQQDLGRRLGLGAALVSRILLLLTIGWVARLTQPVFHLPFDMPPEAAEVSWRDLILIAGGLFLIYKAIKEIHEKLEGDEDGGHVGPKQATLGAIIAQIMVIDVVFSLDSVITAVGMVKEVSVMIIAVIIAIIIMMFAAGGIARFVERHPTVKVLALSFLVLIGVNLVAEGGGQHIEKAYTYFAMAFAIAVEMVNLRVRSKGKPVQLHEPHMPCDPPTDAPAD